MDTSFGVDSIAIGGAIAPWSDVGNKRSSKTTRRLTVIACFSSRSMMDHSRIWRLFHWPLSLSTVGTSLGAEALAGRLVWRRGRGCFYDAGSSSSTTFGRASPDEVLRYRPCFA